MEKLKIKRITVLTLYLISGLLTIPAINSQTGWVQQVSGTGYFLRSSFFVNENIGYVVGDTLSSRHVILKTTNGGTNWIRQSFQPSDSIALKSVFFIDPTNGYACGGGNFSGKILVLKTTTGGSNWFTSYYNNTNYSMNAIWFLNSLTGFGFGDHIVGLGGEANIFRTTDGGYNWSNMVIDTRSNNHVWAQYFLNSSTGYACSDSGIFRTINSGLNWTLLTNLTTIKSLSFINVSTGWALTSFSMWNTVNGGNNWIYLGPLSFSANSVYFSNLQTGWYCGNGIYQTTNGGLNWVQQYTGGSLYSIKFVSSLTGWAVGSSGLILKTTSGGVTAFKPISNEIPEQFSLSQNYPNPFNPISKIKFQIAKLSEAKLIIYDILGKEVTTLINEELTPGVYEVEWDGSNYPSGVYYYVLSVGEFSSTGKAVLIK